MITHQAKLDAMTTALTHWRMPGSTANAPIVQVESPEIAVQNARIATVSSSRFLRDSDISRNPTALSKVEVNLEQRVQASAQPAMIPFFIPRALVPPPPPAEAPAPVPVAAFAPPPVAPPPATPQYDVYGAGTFGTYGTAASSSTHALSGNGGASPEYLQTAGLPAFLVGSNVKALQTVISSPGLLQTFMNSNGQYDEVRLKNLVQNLTPVVAPTQPPAPFPASTAPFSAYAPSAPSYQSASASNQYFPPPPPQAPASTHSFSAYGPQSSQPSGTSQVQPLQTQFSKGGYRGDQNTTDGNLHVSGYGQGATQDEIYAIFAQYVQISELVPKGTFCFINTNDPEGARRAKQALHGSIVGGSPIKINFAVRKERDPNKMRGPKPFGVESRSYSHQQSSEMPTTRSSCSQGSQGGFDNNVKDDRGNPATKNLFVAGYGPGTTEHQIRQLFSQFGQVTGTVMKPSYAFVNFSSKETAIAARQSLMGQSLNGSTLRVNFAKESGRLGTSFDQTYNSSSYGSAPQHGHRTFWFYL
jgi:RNA recognition motif-containing protein